jgi:aldose 1-epimerase
VRGLWREDERTCTASYIISSYSGASNNIGSQGDVLMPFPSRIPGGKYTFAGQSYQLATSGAHGSPAMHGFLRGVLWETTAKSESAVTFSVTVNEGDFEGYPFGLRVTVTYRLGENGFRCDFHAENSGTKDAPFGAGFHPYFTAGTETIDDDLLQIPFQQIMHSGERTGVAGTSWDFRVPRPVGAVHCDAVLTSPERDEDGLARIRFSAPDGSRTVIIWMDQSFDYVVLYSGDTLPPSHQRRALAIEPWTCAPNAFNYPERGLVVLTPGAAVGGSWGVIPT